MKRRDEIFLLLTDLIEGVLSSAHCNPVAHHRVLDIGVDTLAIRSHPDLAAMSDELFKQHLHCIVDRSLDGNENVQE